MCDFLEKGLCRWGDVKDVETRSLPSVRTRVVTLEGAGGQRGHVAVEADVRLTGAGAEECKASGAWRR